MSLFKKKEEETKELQEENPIVRQNDLLKFEQMNDKKYVSSSRFDSELNEIRGELQGIKSEQKYQGQKINDIDKVTSVSQSDIAHILSIVKGEYKCK